MKTITLMLVLLAACKSPDASAVDAATSASANASATTQEAPLDTHGKWWAVAKKSRVYTDDRRLDADNAIRLVPSPTREVIVRALDAMAVEPDTAEGLRAASQLARDAQDRVDDSHNPAARIAVANASLIVLHGMIAQACIDHPNDVAALAPILAAIREMPLPRLEKGDGPAERNVIEQEMRTAVDDKTMKVLLASAPGPKKNI
jgi:hypothetical protein